MTRAPDAPGLNPAQAAGRRAGAPALGRMLEAGSVAVVGASPVPGSFGEQLLDQLLRGGFAGRVHPVNPKYRELGGLECLPDLAALPAPVDLVLLGVANARLETQLSAAAAAGAGSAVVFASCWSPPSADPPLAARLQAIARDAGMALCGGNGMGFINFEHRLRACGFYEPLDLEPGPVTLVTHSGSVFSALLHNHRQLSFNLAVSPGLELTTTIADYLGYALERERTRAVALFLETARDPAGLRAVLDRAAACDVPVVALKVGRTDWAGEMVAAHSGALAGDDAAYEALFDATGVLRVRTLDELCDTVELLAAPRRAGPGGLAAVHDSGGERAHLIDAAEEAGVGFAQIGPATVRTLEEVLDPGLPAVNPLDAWGTGHDAATGFADCMRALLADPATAALALCVDLTTEVDPAAGYGASAVHALGRSPKPVAVLANLAAGADRAQAARLRAAGIPVLEGTATGLAAFRHLFEYRDFRARPPARPGTPPAPEVGARWRARLARPAPWSEAEALRLLADYGMPVVPTAEVTNLAGALAAGERLGWPVVVKTATSGVAHKSDQGGVRLGVSGREQLAAAYTELAGRLGPRAVVQRQAPPGVELALGVVRDPQFGPLLMAAAGGLLVEVLADRRFALPPLDLDRARALLDRLAVRRLLGGVRGSPAADLDAVAGALVGLSALALELGDWLDALDVNPLLASPGGCVAVDALVVARAAAS